MNGLQLTFYLSGVVAIGATFLAITRLHAVHALLYFIISLFAVALIFFVLGATFIAALEVIVYAGAIVVLVIFVVMLLGGAAAADRERRLLARRGWLGPAALTSVLALDVFYLLARGQGPVLSESIEPARVGAALFGTYCLGVELASLLLLAGLVGAYHLGRPRAAKGLSQSEERHGHDSHGARPAAGGDPVPRRSGRTPRAP